MPATGHNTAQEYLPTVEQDLTTESPWSESMTQSGPSRTHGDHLGEKEDSSDWPEETPVVSATWLHIQTNDNS